MNNNIVDRETLELAIEALEGQQKAIQAKLDKLREAVGRREGSSSQASSQASPHPRAAKRPKRQISKAGIEAIRKAQKARWAQIKKAAAQKKAGKVKKTSPAKPKAVGAATGGGKSAGLGA